MTDLPTIPITRTNRPVKDDQMTKQTIAQLFVAVLREAVEVDRLNRKHRLAVRSVESARRFRQRFLPEVSQARQAPEPVDCVQHFAAAPGDWRMG